MAAVPELAELLRETAEAHDPYEKGAPPHHWWDWYAAYMTARHEGRTPEEARVVASRYMLSLVPH